MKGGENTLADVSVKKLGERLIVTSDAVLAETSLRSPRILFIGIIKKIFIGSKYPKK